VQININEQELTELLHALTEEWAPEGGKADKGTNSEKAVKRKMRLKEVMDDIHGKLEKGEDFTPADLFSCCGLFLLLVLEYSGFISFPYQDIFEWKEFKKLLYELATVFGEVFDFKKGRGRPTEAVGAFLAFSGAFCREHNSPSCDHRYKCTCNYICLLSDILKLRLARSQEWHRRGIFEKRKILWREFRAAKTAVDRFWKHLYGQKPPKLDNKDKEFIENTYL